MNVIFFTFKINLVEFKMANILFSIRYISVYFTHTNIYLSNVFSRRLLNTFSLSSLTATAGPSWPRRDWPRHRMRSALKWQQR